MKEPDFAGFDLSSARVAVWGLGLMGGSLAMALNGKCAELVGIDKDPAVIALAVDRGVVQTATTDPRSGLDGADLIILAMPVCTILDVMADIPKLCKTPAVIIDLGSTKSEIMRAMAKLPERFAAVGGHPMCGKEKSTLENADANLFQGAAFGLVSLDRTPVAARQIAENLVAVLGAHPVWVDAEDHDRWVASTSHVPFLMASALAGCTPQEAAPLVSPGFRGAARLAKTDPGMMMDILATNTENVRHALAQFRAVLDRYDDLMEQEQYTELAGLFTIAADNLQALERKQS